MSNTKSDIETYLNRLKKTFNKSKIKLAEAALFEVINNSPVRTGAYVENNQIGLNTPVTTNDIVYHKGPGFAQPMDVGSAFILKNAVYKQEIRIAKTAKFEDTIYISNSTPYAHIVEYVGWPQYGVPAYHPYGRAALSVKAKMYLIIKSNAPLE